MSGFTSSGQALDKTENYDYDACDQLTCVDSVGFEYDMNGNLAKKRDDMAGDMVYKFNYANRLREVLFADGTKAQYVYKSDGMRISRTDRTGKTTKYYRDSSNIPEALNEGDEDGNITLNLFPGTGFKSTKNGNQNGNQNSTSSQWRWFITDHLGSVIALTDINGIITDEYTYDEYGTITQTKGTSYNPCKYIGQQYDEETGLIYLRARYYDSQTGRFVSRDPIGIRGGMNEYGYAIYNQLRFTDIRGLQPEEAKTHYEIEENKMATRTSKYFTKYNIENNIRDYWATKYPLPVNALKNVPNCDEQSGFNSWFFYDYLNRTNGISKETHYRAKVRCMKAGSSINGHVAFAIMRCPGIPPKSHNIFMIIDTWTPVAEDGIRNLLYRNPMFFENQWKNLWHCSSVEIEDWRLYRKNDISDDSRLLIQQLRGKGLFPKEVIWP